MYPKEFYGACERKKYNHLCVVCIFYKLFKNTVVKLFSKLISVFMKITGGEEVKSRGSRTETRGPDFRS